MEDTRDSIDFGKQPIGKLFTKLFIPTLLGLFFGALLNIADGIFVGRGVGSDALAAINIAAPVFLLSSGIALLFGSGVSVVAAIHLGRGNVKAARINITQAFTVALLLIALLMSAVCLFPEVTGRLFGGSPRLMPLVVKYLFGITPGIIAYVVTLIGLYVLRLDGSPRWASSIQVVCSLLNIFLDWWMVFPLQLGIEGAAWATSISECLGALAIVYYMFFRTKQLPLYLPKFTKKAIRLTLRNVGYMGKLGFSTFIGEIAITVIMIVGNYQFIRHLGEDGVAAFSVACYLFPLVFMIGQAISQSALPITSYNYGMDNWERVREIRRLSFFLAVMLGIGLTGAGVMFTPAIALLFLGDCPAYAIAVEGLPYYSGCFAFFTTNIVLIGYFQSIERATVATTFMLLRGLIFVVPAFLLLPVFLGSEGLWWAITTSEGITCACIVAYYIWTYKDTHTTLGKQLK